MVLHVGRGCRGLRGTLLCVGGGLVLRSIPADWVADNGPIAGVLALELRYCTLGLL